MNTVFLALILLFDSARLFAQAPTPPHPVVTAFVAVNVVPMDRDRILPNQTVLIEEGKIKAIGPSLHVPSDAVVIDGRGTAFLSPRAR